MVTQAQIFGGVGGSSTIGSPFAGPLNLGGGASRPGGIPSWILELIMSGDTETREVNMGLLREALQETRDVQPGFQQFAQQGFVSPEEEEMDIARARESVFRGSEAAQTGIEEAAAARGFGTSGQLFSDLGAEIASRNISAGQAGEGARQRVRGLNLQAQQFGLSGLAGLAGQRADMLSQTQIMPRPFELLTQAADPNFRPSGIPGLTGTGPQGNLRAPVGSPQRRDAILGGGGKFRS